jgi:FkbM family methyltransferase
LLDTKDYISRKFLIGGGFESDLVDAIISAISLRKPSVFVDVGSNFGLYSCIAAVGGVPQIHSFEPNPRLVAFQRTNFAMNDFRGIKIHGFGLSDVDADDQQFLISLRSNSGLSRLEKLAADQNWQSGTISQRRLDGLLAPSNRTVIVKIDVEGAEQFFVRGAKTFLMSNSCDLFIEITQDFETTRSALAALGYAQLREFHDGNFWFTNYRLSP